MMSVIPGRLFVLTLETSRRQAAFVANAARRRLGTEPVIVARARRGPAWIEFYFPGETEALLASRACSDLPMRLAGIRPCDPASWQDAWKAHFTSQPVGRRLLVCPPWESGRTGAKRIPVVIEPGLSFGTGQHFTTRYCLEQIEVLSHPQPPGSLLDLGAGSGILAIAAARLGCPRVLAVDHDPTACAQIRTNAAMNRVASKVRIRCRDLAHAPPARGRFEIVCANLYTGLLCRCAAIIAAAAQRWLLLAGMLEDDADRVAAAFAYQGWEECQRDGDGEWAGLRLRPARHGMARKEAP